MADTVNSQVVDSVASANLKTLGDGPAFYQNMQFGQLVQAQNRLSILAETALASAVRSLAVTPQEEASASSTDKHSDLSGLISSLLAALGHGQQAAKVAQSTPPETAVK